MNDETAQDAQSAYDSALKTAAQRYRQIQDLRGLLANAERTIQEQAVALLERDRETLRLKNELHADVSCLRDEKAELVAESEHLADQLLARDDSLYLANKEIERLEAELAQLREKPGTLAGERVYPTLHMRTTGNTLAGRRFFLQTPSGDTIPLVSVTTSASDKSPLTASVELLIDGIETGREA